MIKRVTIKNYKNIENETIDFVSGSNLASPTHNEAIASALSSMWLKTTKRFKMFKPLNERDFRITQVDGQALTNFPEIDIEVDFPDFKKSWTVTYKSAPKVSDKEVLDFGNVLFEHQKLKTLNNPVIAYYSNIVEGNHKYDSSCCYNAYESCLIGDIRERHINEMIFVGCATYFRNYPNVHDTKHLDLPIRKHITTYMHFAVIVLPTLLEALNYEVKSLKLYPLSNYNFGGGYPDLKEVFLDTNGKPDIENSKYDGYKNFIRFMPKEHKKVMYIIYDIIRRAVDANPDIDSWPFWSILSVRGIVLIDDISETAKRLLSAVFQNIQFISN